MQVGTECRTWLLWRTELFEHAPQRVLSALSLGFGDGVDGETKSLLPCETPAALSNPQMEALAPICQAIHSKRPVAIHTTQ